MARTAISLAELVLACGPAHGDNVQFCLSDSFPSLHSPLDYLLKTFEACNSSTRTIGQVCGMLERCYAGLVVGYGALRHNSRMVSPPTPVLNPSSRSPHSGMTKVLKSSPRARQIFSMIIPQADVARVSPRSPR